MKVTPAEQRALDAVYRHGSVKAAAYALSRSPRTVEQQLRTARARLGVDTTLQAYVKTTDIVTTPD